MYKQHKDISLMASFLWLKASIADINTTDVYIKNMFPLNI